MEQSVSRKITKSSATAEIARDADDVNFSVIRPVTQFHPLLLQSTRHTCIWFSISTQ